MSAELPSSLLESPDAKTLIDACYFIIRALRNATRGYQNPAVSTEPSPAAYSLAQRAIQELETREREPIRSWGQKRTSEYITLLEELLRTSYRRTVGEDPGNAADILAQMRSSGLAG